MMVIGANSLAIPSRLPSFICWTFAHWGGCRSQSLSLRPASRCRCHGLAAFYAFLQGAGFAAQILHLAGGRGTGGVAGQAALARFHELLRPGVIQALGNAFLAAQLGNAVLAAQAIQHDADLVLGREVPTGLPPDVLHHPLSRGLHGDFFKEGWGFIFVPSSLRRSPNPP
jgi:hypothetical protein